MSSVDSSNPTSEVASGDLAASSSRALLQLKDLEKRYPQPDGGLLTVLDIPEFKIDAGEQVVLIGQSGGGKTTLLHAIAGIIAPDSGSIIVGGLDITRLSEAGRDRYRAGMIGYVFQTFNLLAGFTAIENVRLGMTFASGRQRHPACRDPCSIVLASVIEFTTSHPSSRWGSSNVWQLLVPSPAAQGCCSPMNQQPTLTPANQQTIIDLIRETCTEEGVALLMVTHSMEMANQFDRIENLEKINQAMDRET